MLACIPLGTVEIAVSFVGYLSVSQKIRFENGSAQEANLQLRPNVQMLDAVTIRANPKGPDRHLRQFKKQLFGEPFGGQITVASTGPARSFVKSAAADRQGRFRLPGLVVTDTVQLMVQIADVKSRHIPVAETFLIREDPGRLWEPGKTVTKPGWSALRPELEAARSRQEANAGFYRDKTAKQLREVTVKARKHEERPDDIQARSLHNEADAVAVFEEKSPVYANLYEMVQGRFAGVSVLRTVGTPTGPPAPPGYKVMIRGLNSFNSGTTLVSYGRRAHSGSGRNLIDELQCKGHRTHRSFKKCENSRHLWRSGWEWSDRILY